MFGKIKSAGVLAAAAAGGPVMYATNGGAACDAIAVAPAVVCSLSVWVPFRNQKSEHSC